MTKITVSELAKQHKSSMEIKQSNKRFFGHMIKAESLPKTPLIGKVGRQKSMGT